MSSEEITHFVGGDGAVRRTQWSQGDKEDGSSSRTQLHEREEGGVGKEPKV